MARTSGSRNHDFEDKRRALLNTLTAFALSGDIRRPSLRQFAQAAGTAEPTLRHYFNDRQGVVIAVLEALNERSQPIWNELAKPSASVAEAVHSCFTHALNRMENDDFVRMHAFGLVEGVADPVVGEAYLKLLLDPSMDCAQRKLSGTPGAPTTPAELRAAALAMFSPIILLCIHQDLLGGSRITPVDDRSTVLQLSAWLSEAFSEPA